MLLLLLDSSLLEPLGISLDTLNRDFLADTTHIGIVLPLFELLLIHLLIEPVHFSHFLDLI